jgi:hypothetical protein
MTQWKVYTDVAKMDHIAAMLLVAELLHVAGTGIVRLATNPAWHLWGREAVGNALGDGKDVGHPQTARISTVCAH